MPPSLAIRRKFKPSFNDAALRVAALAVVTKMLSFPGGKPRGQLLIRSPIMDRRSFLTAGSGIAAAGVAAVALTATPARAATKASPTVFDYGAVGDGNTDDSAAFT